MSKKLIVAGTALASGLFTWSALAQNDAKAALATAAKAMSVDSLKTVVVAGEGWDGAGCVGQEYAPIGPNWRKMANKNYKRSIDFEAKGWRVERLRGEGEPAGMTGGCGDRPIVEAQQNQVTMATNGANLTEYEMLPQGFVRTAMTKSDATAKEQTIKGKKYTVVSFKGENGQSIDGYINDQGLVERVATMTDNFLLGDMIWDANYSDWKDFNGVKFPTHIVQTQGGRNLAEWTLASVTPNAPVDLTQAGRGGAGGAKGGDGKGKAVAAADGKGKAPAADGKGKGAPAGGGRGGAAAAPMSEDLGNGAWLITGGYGSVVMDFKTFIVVCEGPSNDMRAEQIIAEAHRLIPNKPIKYVLNTHHHSDHSGGLRAFVAEGATIVTSEKNKGYYEKIFKNPHTIVPDKLSKMNPQPKIKVSYVGEKKIITDGVHNVELHHVQGTSHDPGMLLIYLPKQKVIVEGDEFNVGATPTYAPPLNPYHANFLANIERLKLDVDRIIPVHLPNDGRKVTMAELKSAAGRN